MLKLLGAILLMGGCMGAAFGKIRLLDNRIHALRSLVYSLEVIERELDFRLTPMDELFDAAAEGAAEPISGLFRACSRELKIGMERPFSEHWERCVRERIPLLKGNDLESILSLGGILGRYDSEGQKQAVARVRATLSQSLANELSERKNQGKVYGVLGATAGLFLVILLL